MFTTTSLSDWCEFDDIDASRREISFEEFYDTKRVNKPSLDNLKSRVAQSMPPEVRDEIAVVAKLRKYQGLNLGRLVNLDDVENGDRELETIIMLRQNGIESNVGDITLDSRTTRGSAASSKPILFNNNFPILLSEKFFKLKPVEMSVEGLAQNSDTLPEESDNKKVKSKKGEVEISTGHSENARAGETCDNFLNKNADKSHIESTIPVPVSYDKHMESVYARRKAKGN